MKHQKADILPEYPLKYRRLYALKKSTSQFREETDEGLFKMPGNQVTTQESGERTGKTREMHLAQQSGWRQEHFE